MKTFSLLNSINVQDIEEFYDNVKSSKYK